MGRDEYAFMTSVIRASGYLTALKMVIGGLCIAVAVLGLLVMLHPLGPHGTGPRAIQITLACSALVVGALWLLGRWPSYRLALAFVIWADLALGIAALILPTPQLQMSTVVDMALVGVFATFLLGLRILALHCALAMILIVAITARSVVEYGYGWLDLYPFQAPAFAAVVVLPIVVQVIVEGGRRAVRATVQHAVQDPMTGLHNRRGMYVAAKNLLANRPSATLVAAMIDLDRFKELNDRRGHHSGDDALRTVGKALGAAVQRGDIAARLGGDEFAVIAAMESDAIEGFIERLRSALQTIGETTTASVGVAWQAPHSGATDVDSLLRQADRAMYDAKRLGGNQLIVAPAT